MTNEQLRKKIDFWWGRANRRAEIDREFEMFLVAAIRAPEAADNTERLAWVKELVDAYTRRGNFDISEYPDVKL